MVDLNEFDVLMLEEDTQDENSSQQIPVTELEYSLEDKVQEDLDLIALVEGNPKLYMKGKSGYRNTQEKDLAWISIGKAMKSSISGVQAKHRWETLRNLYGRSRREIMALIKQQELSGSGKDDVSYENLLTPQSKAIHRFMSRLYIPRKTCSNYTSPSSSTSSASLSPASGNKPSSKLYTKSIKQSLVSQSAPQTQISSKNSPIDSFIWNQGFVESASESSESTDNQSKRQFMVPKSDVKKRKKLDPETEIIKESSQAIFAACSALPALLSGTNQETEEEKGIISVLLHGLKRVPVQQKTQCMIKLLETLESFNKAE